MGVATRVPGWSVRAIAVLALLSAPTAALAQAGSLGPVAPSAIAESLDSESGPSGEPVDPTGINTADLANQAPALPNIREMNPIEVMAGASQMLGRSGSSGSGGSRPEGGLSGAINVVVLLTVITLVPSIMLMTTCFVRMIVVLGLVRQALGTQTLPPPQVLLGLSLFMTLLVMSPTIDRVHAEAIAPYNRGEIRDYGEMWDRAKQPLRDFMFDQIEATGNWSSVYMMLNYRGIDTSEPERLTTDDVDMISLIPAFMLSEIKTAFLIGFKVYLPFLVIDMVIAGVLISMGMMMLPPVLISLPFKLLLFVLVDGWTLVVGSLLTSFVVRNGGIEAAQAVQEAGQQLSVAVSTLASSWAGVRAV